MDDKKKNRALTADDVRSIPVGAEITIPAPTERFIKNAQSTCSYVGAVDGKLGGFRISTVVDRSANRMTIKKEAV